ncbi:unnamed protein product [Calicophoron daubneyi]|uniref:Uncharacterized protein n=1 Tax=Calicophoron daubneyi TaxID=300641 RepID=A0AAV2TLP9_CALDB
MRFAGIPFLVLLVVSGEACNRKGPAGPSQSNNQANQKQPSCLNLFVDIVKECFLKNMKEQKCDTSTISNMLSGLSSLIRKRGLLGSLSGLASKANLDSVVNSKNVNALTSACNACTKCKMSAKSCILLKVTTYDKGGCALIDQLRKFALNII